MKDSLFTRGCEFAGAIVVGLVVLALVLLLAGCTPAFHPPHEGMGRLKCGVMLADGTARCPVAWGYSVPVPGHGDLLAYFGLRGGVGNGEQRCHFNRTNVLAARRVTSATECRPVTVAEGGSLWAISLLNSDDGFVFQSREDCETGRRENDWSKAGYPPSACTPVSVTVK